VHTPRSKSLISPFFFFYAPSLQTGGASIRLPVKVRVMQGEAYRPLRTQVLWRYTLKYAFFSWLPLVCYIIARTPLTATHFPTSNLPKLPSSCLSSLVQVISRGCVSRHCAKARIDPLTYVLIWYRPPGIRPAPDIKPHSSNIYPVPLKKRNHVLRLYLTFV